MKKNYITPSMDICNVETENVILGTSTNGTVIESGSSASVGGSNAGTMGSGDVDAASYRNNLWDN